jgi:LEA14-like dessication related protein
LLNKLFLLNIIEFLNGNIDMGKLKLIPTFFVIVWFFGLSCSSLAPLIQSSQIRKPQATFKKMDITGLTFDKIDLEFSMVLKNPNSFRIKLDGFDYSLDINNNRFINGKQDNQLEVESEGETIIQFPLTVQFREVQKIFKSFTIADSAEYLLECGFFFRLPILGKQRIPLKNTGKIPLLKIPNLTLHSLRLNKLSLTRAEFQLNLTIDNRNNLPLFLGKINYQLDIDNNNWIIGSSSLTKELTQKGQHNVTIPFNLDFLELGSSLYQLIKENQSFQYHFKGDTELSSEKMSQSITNLPFNLSGQINIQK